jgi:iron(III) transport system permease protein
MERRLTLSAAALVPVAIGLAPVLAMVAKTFYATGGFGLGAYEALLASGKQLTVLMGHSVLLSLSVTTLAVITGVPLGVLLGRTDLPLRGTLAILLALPLLVPPYVIAVACFTALGPAGMIARSLPAPASEFLASALFSFYGCTGVLTAAFLPIPMLLTIAFVKRVNPRLEQAGLLMSSWPSVLRRITLPLIAPALVFAAMLVFLLTLGEVGVASYLRYPVYPAEVLTQFAAFYDFSAATAAAIPMLLVTVLILALEFRFVHASIWELSAPAYALPAALIKLGRWRFPLFGLVLAWALVTVALPVAMLILQSASLSVFADALSRAGDSILRSVVFAAAGATLLTALGFFLGYLVYSRALAWWRAIDALALFLFTLPGTVIGIGLISLWNRPLTNAIYATPAIIIFGYVAQYVVLPMRMTAATFQRIPSSLERAAQLCGANWFMTLRDILLPLARSGLIAAWIIAYVFCMRDLGITMVVYPPGSDTLPVRILTLMANGTPSLIAALCLILIAVTLLPLFVAAFWARHGGRSI